jgi:preprotein translocase subunit SecB
MVRKPKSSAAKSDAAKSDARVADADKAAPPAPAPEPPPAPAPTTESPPSPPTQAAAAGAAAPTAAAAAQPERVARERPPPPFSVNAQYTKDLSFEVPAAPRIFGMMQSQAPDISINVDVRAQPMPENAYEVTIHVHAKCQVGDTVAFVLELAYAGLFTVNVPREQLGPLLLIECPRILFPFARNIIADASRDGGFPPLMLGPVDFAAMYRNQLARERAAAAATPAAAPSPAEAAAGRAN